MQETSKIVKLHDTKPDKDFCGDIQKVIEVLSGEDVTGFAIVVTHKDGSILRSASADSRVRNIEEIIIASVMFLQTSLIDGAYCRIDDPA